VTLLLTSPSLPPPSQLSSLLGVERGAWTPWRLGGRAERAGSCGGVRERPALKTLRPAAHTAVPAKMAKLETAMLRGCSLQIGPRASTTYMSIATAALLVYSRAKSSISAQASAKAMIQLTATDDTAHCNRRYSSLQQSAAGRRPRVRMLVYSAPASSTSIATRQLVNAMEQQAWAQRRPTQCRD
jgi:hypothetical protein